MQCLCSQTKRQLKFPGCAVVDTDTTEIKLYHKDIRATLEIVHDLRAQGLEQGQDFDFAFHPSTGWDLLDHVDSDNAHVSFMFYHKKWATWFELKWT